MAAAVEASGGVDADGVHATRVADTLVYVDALHVGIALVANGAHAVDAIDALATLGASATLGGSTVSRLVFLRSTGFVRVSAVAGVADAPIGLSILAMSITATTRCAERRSHSWRNTIINL